MNLDPKNEVQIRQNEDLELISKLAEQRRMEAKAVLEQPPPDIVVAIPRSEVMYTIGRRMLPYSQVKFEQFSNILSKIYNVKFVRPDLTSLLKGIPSEVEVKITDTQIGEMLLALPEPILKFEHGRFPLSRNDFVPIAEIFLTYESIHVAVSGISKVAELVASEVIETLWSSTGTEKKWEEIKPNIKLITYGTSTKVDLGFPIERLLHPQFCEFINTQMLDGEKYASQMGAHSVRHHFQPSPTIVSVYNLDDLKILFHHFDTQTGRFEDSQLAFSVVSKDEQGTGITVVSSTLPFDKHTECLLALKRALETAE